MCLVFFFKQKTAYEMRISDWSSDVCSSDLHDPDSCIIDVWSLERYAEGKQPPVKREFYADWRDPEARWGRILEQDFANMLAVQKGNKSRVFNGDRKGVV